MSIKQIHAIYCYMSKKKQVKSWEYGSVPTVRVEPEETLGSLSITE